MTSSSRWYHSVYDCNDMVWITFCVVGLKGLKGHWGYFKTLYFDLWFSFQTGIFHRQTLTSVQIWQQTSLHKLQACLFTTAGVKKKKQNSKNSLKKQTKKHVNNRLNKDGSVKLGLELFKKQITVCKIVSYMWTLLGVYPRGHCWALKCSIYT